MQKKRSRAAAAAPERSSVLDSDGPTQTEVTTRALRRCLQHRQLLPITKAHTGMYPQQTQPCVLALVLVVAVVAPYLVYKCSVGVRREIMFSYFFVVETRFALTTPRVVSCCA